MASQSARPILIVGAGISGLTLAQACRKQNISYQLFERDTSATHRRGGWGLTLNWALETFRSLLPDNIVERLPETYVNKGAVDAGEKGSFTFFDLSTGEAKWKVPASERIRVSRERLRTLMLCGLDVQYSKLLSDIRKDDNGVTVTFDDGSSTTGCIVVGCDGANSQVRRLCHPDSFSNDQLPVRFIGAGVRYTEDQVAAIRELDPYFLQGSDPRIDTFLWFSFLDTPSDHVSTSASDGLYGCQIMISWPHRPGFFGRAEPTDVPNTSTGQLSWMKTLSKDWAEPFRSLIHDIPHDAHIKPIDLSDWLPRRTEAYDGRVVLLGDAAHAMVMFRGEGANHAIVDVERLLNHIKPMLRQDEVVEDAPWKDAVAKYEAEMIERTEVAVMASRQACLDANDFKRINDQSPLVRRRLMKADLEEVKRSHPQDFTANAQ